MDELKTRRLRLRKVRFLLEMLGVLMLLLILNKLMCQWHLLDKVLELGELSLKQLRIMPGELQMSLEELKLGEEANLLKTMIRLKIDLEKDASNAEKKDICLENVQMETHNQEREVVLNVEEKVIEQRTALENNSQLNRLKNLLENEEDASSAEVMDIELENVLEKEIKKNDLEEEEKMKIQT